MLIEFFSGSEKAVGKPLNKKQSISKQCTGSETTKQMQTTILFQTRGEKNTYDNW